MIVHTINKSDIWPSCSELFTQDDELVLLEDGVYLALDKVSKACAIQADVEARGLLDRVPGSIRLIDYPDFVRLCTQAEKVCAWF